jgi:hypothetical protein
MLRVPSGRPSIQLQGYDMKVTKMDSGAKQIHYTVKRLTIYSPWPGIIKLFPARESLVCDIPAGAGKIFFTV